MIIAIYTVLFIIILLFAVLYKKQPLKILNRPFLNIYYIDKDGNQRATNIIIITQPFTEQTNIDTYYTLKRQGNLFIGMTSYSEFPKIMSNPYDRLRNPRDIAWAYNYTDLVDAWLYCFRNPKDYIPGNKPSILLSESDFADYELHIPNPKIEYDFMYVCLKDNDKCEDGWQSYIRNWKVTKKMLDIMCEEYGLKGLLIGRIGCDIPGSCNHLVELTDFQQYTEFIENYNKCRFIFLPNTVDASPRVATEAMCYNLPLFMNYDILGGWKYVVPGITGEFFNLDLESFRLSLKNFLENLNRGLYSPREYFINNYGAINSGKKLLEFIKTLYPEKYLNFNFNDVKYIKPGV